MDYHLLPPLATAEEAAAWQTRRASHKKTVCSGATGPFLGGVGIYDGRDTTANVEGRAYWRDGQPVAAFLGEIVALYERKSGHAPAVAICHPCHVDELRAFGLVTRSAPVNIRLVILCGGAP